MTNAEIEHLILKQYSPRKRTLKTVLSNGARRTPRVESRGDRCVICTRAEHGGGLSIYRCRDGSEILLGKRCAGFLDHLIANPNRAQPLLA